MEEIRKQFEAWFCKEIVEQPVIFPKFADGEYTEGDDYDFEFYQMLQAMWMTWKASRAALVVDIASHTEFEIEHMISPEKEGYSTGWIDGRSYSVKQVLAAGITVKGEGDGKTNVLPQE